jgi:L-ascorbate metabolism protein UlaG (beta-lactamase superfamily)
MKLTKYNHACLTLEKDGKLLVIDPGNFSTDFIAPEDIIGIIVTHKHPDHFDPELIAAIIDKNPDVKIIAHHDVTSEIEAFDVQTVDAGDHISIGPFTLDFFGGQHETVHRSIPVIANLAVMVDDLFYYAGDSYTLPKKPVDTLAVPAGAPWLKIGEAMDYLAAINPRFAFPTHDAVLSYEGKQLADRLLLSIAQRYDIEYERLDAPIEI